MTIQPAGCQPQAAASIHTPEPSAIARMMKALIRIRSSRAPDMIEAVVAENMVNAAQKMPVALSEMLGPILSSQGRKLVASAGTRPPGNAP